MHIHGKDSATECSCPRPLIVPSPLPDELDRGYFGALMRANGITEERTMDLFVANRIGIVGQSRREYSRVELLSKVTGESLGDFLREHTTLPLRRAITSYQHEIEHASEANAQILWYSGMRVIRAGAYFCRDCVNEDVTFHGRSYWRREHQMPGLFWCPKHQTALCYRDEEKSFRYEPSRFLNDCHVVRESCLDDQKRHAVKAFHTISSALLERRAPFGVKFVAETLRRRAAQLGLQKYSGKVHSPLLSDAVVAAFGREWLSTVMPALAKKRNGEMLHQMDGVLFMQTSASSSTAYILALSVLFDTAEDALNALIYPQPSVIPNREKTIRTTVDSKGVRYAYLCSRGSYRSAASHLDVSYSTAVKRFGSAGLPNLGGKRGQRLERAAVAFFKEGKSLAESAAAQKLSVDALESIVRIAGAMFSVVLDELNCHDHGQRTKITRKLRLTPNKVQIAKEQLMSESALVNSVSA